MQVFVVAFGVFMLVAALFLGAALLVSRARRRRHHDRLVRHIRRFRFHKMLSYLGIDIDAYARNVPADEIIGQLRRCAHCTEIELCDACLNGKHVEDMHFCPNYPSIIEQGRLAARR